MSAIWMRFLRRTANQKHVEPLIINTQSLKGMKRSPAQEILACNHLEVELRFQDGSIVSGCLTASRNFHRGMFSRADIEEILDIDERP